MTELDIMLAFLALASLLNCAALLYFTRVRGLPEQRPDGLIQPNGMPLPDFSGASRSSETVHITEGARTAYALIFLSAGCPKCRDAAPLVLRAALHTATLGVDLWVITADRLSAADIGKDRVFEDWFLDVSELAYAALNPRRVSPAYLFVGPDMITQASGLIGDEDWQSFVAQIEPGP